MTDALRPLPILMEGGALPMGFALEALKRAKAATGYEGMVLPVKALPGSPEPILAVGVTPSWLTDYAYLPDLNSVDRITAALTAILMVPNDPRLNDRTDCLSNWFGVEVTYLGEESVST